MFGEGIENEIISLLLAITLDVLLTIGPEIFCNIVEFCTQKKWLGKNVVRSMHSCRLPRKAVVDGDCKIIGQFFSNDLCSSCRIENDYRPSQSLAKLFLK